MMNINRSQFKIPLKFEKTDSSKFLWEIDKEDTLRIKGLAVLLLLCHHVFVFPPASAAVVFPDSIIEFGKLGKVCVHIFLIVSGYGLVFSMQKCDSIWDFYKSRLLKLFPTFWIIALMGLSVSWFVFGLTPEIVYKSACFKNYPLPPYLCLGLQFLGLQDLFPFYGYNPTWWFMTLILFCYVVFPFLLESVKKYPIMTLLGITVATQSHLIARESQWLIPFVLGMSMAVLCLLQKNNKNTVSRYIKLLWFIICVIILLLMIMAQHICQLKYLWMTRNTLLAFSIIGILCMVKSGRWLTFLGKYSYGIFLCHTFIFRDWFTNIVYYFHNPLWCFAIVCCASVLWAVSVDLILKFLIKFFSKHKTPSGRSL